jgi:ATP-dependent protease HslVU (ClpYQ) peptidase subunit
MNAIKQIRKYLEQNPESEAAQILTRLSASLAEEGSFSLADLYRLDYDSFTLAVELLKDWRLDRYYAARLRLIEAILDPQRAVEPETEAVTH